MDRAAGRPASGVRERGAPAQASADPAHRPGPAAKLSPAATTTVIDRLERAGFVTRSRDAANRRRVLVVATEAARTAEHEVYGPLGEAGASALRRYSKEQLAVITDFLETARQLQEAQTTRLKGLPVRE
ncbi:MarR family transcriptional regulator [Streptomyces roseolus]|uniref:MarR family winged helix-turn-helix transcriptional regulator n=1 Tax=Streptomyces roseolus TaxID=67358 RepID=UPI00340E66F2